MSRSGVALVHLLHVVLMFGGVLGCSHEQDQAPPPAATFAIEAVEVGDACASVGNYCVEVACTVRNTGPIEGVAEVEISLLPGRKPPRVRTQTASIPVAGSAVLVGYFNRATKSDENRGVCDVR